MGNRKKFRVTKRNPKGTARPRGAKPVTPLLTAELVGGKLKVTASHDGRVVHLDTIDFDRAPQRERFIRGVCKRLPGADAATVEADLMKLPTTLPPRSKAEPTNECGANTVPPPVKVVLTDRPDGTVTAGRDGATLHLDKFDPRNAKQRERYITALKEKVPDLDAADADSQLLAIAEQRMAEAPSGPAPAVGGELDVSHVNRPELFHTPGVSGVAVPVVMLVDGKPAARWHLYLHWPDGRREARPLAESLGLPGGGRLWLHPTPAGPSMSMPSGWSAAARREWLDCVPAPDPAVLFREVCAAVADYLEFPPESAAGTAATLTLWVLLSYGYPAWPAVPYLYVGGPMGSGKSRLFDVLARLVHRPLSSSNLTGPALFRTLHDRGGVVLYDEAERLRQSTPDVQELLSMLLAGYRRGGQATRLEAVGDSFRPVAFDVYGPKAVACIQGLPPALASRCIPVMMFRAGPESPKPRRRIDADADRWQQLRDHLHALALDAGPDWLELSRRSDVCPDGIGGRDYELWQPILALAAWVESFGAKGLLALVQRHALETVAASKDDAVPEADEVLLELLADAVQNSERPTPSDIFRRAQERDATTFGKWGPRAVSNRLAVYGVAARKVDRRREYRASLADLARIQRHYGIDLDISDPTPSETASRCVPCVPEISVLGRNGTQRDGAKG
jgi:hypothetical protein